MDIPRKGNGIDSYGWTRVGGTRMRGTKQGGLGEEYGEVQLKLRTI